MIFIRRLLQLACGLVCLVVLVLISEDRSELSGKASLLGALIFFVLLILVLGPWWPSADKVEKWRLDLPTDNPHVATFFLAIIFATVSFHSAWQAYSEGPQVYRRWLGFIAQIAGQKGVIFVWILFGALGLVGTRTAYKTMKQQKRKTKSAPH